MQPIKSLIALIGTFGMLIYAYGDSTEELKRSIVLAILIHSVIIVIFYFFRDLQIALNSLTGFVSKSQFRVNGFTHSYGTTSLIHIFAIPLVYELYNGVKRVFMLFLIIISAFMLARVGLYLGIIILILISFKDFRFRKLLLASISVYVGYTILLFIANTDPKSFSGATQLYFLTVRWALESFLSLVDSGTLDNGSLETLRLLYFNDTLLEHIFGTGDFGRNEIRLKTDISYLLYYSYCGLIGCILLIYIHIRLKLNSIRNICLLVILLLTALKEPTFFTRGLWSAYVLLLYIDYVTSKGCAFTRTSTENQIT